MLKALNSLIVLLVSMVLVIVLFSDLLPLPLDGYASQRFILAAILALGCIVAGAAWVSASGLQSFNQVWPALWVASSFLLLSLPFADRSHAWVEPGMYAAFFFGFVFIGSLAGSCDQKYRWAIVLVYGATIAAAFYGFATIMIYLFALLDGVTDLSAFIPWGFVNIRYWSHIATWIIPLLALTPLIGPFRGQRLWQLLCAVAAALWWWVAFLSTARGTMLGVAVGVFIAVVFIGRPTLPWLKVFLKYLAYGAFVWLLLSVLIPSFLSEEASVRTLKMGSAGRMVMFVEAWQMSLENFPFGLGPQSWLTHDILTAGYLQSSRFGHPHNMYLMWAAEYGWLLIAVLSILVCQAILLFWRRRTEVSTQGGGEQVLPLAAYTASVSAALLHAGVSAVFMAPGSMLVGFLVLCVFWALISSHRKMDVKRGKARLLVSCVIAVILSVLAVFWLREVVAYHQAMMEDRDSRYGSVPYGTPPRFWYYGDYPRRDDAATEAQLQ